MATVTGAREGDWKCGGCGNRNYAFRSICNRCKQARLLVDSQTPWDSKWLSRIGDWICAGCSNNNYASREKCNKCSQPKEVGALAPQAIAVPGPVIAEGLARGVNVGSQTPMPMIVPSVLGRTWPWDHFAGGCMTSNVPGGVNFRVGDWICACGFHNYSSRVMCKQCHTRTTSVVAEAGAAVPTASSMPPQNFTLQGSGTKRLATEVVGGDWASKRLNMGIDSSSNHHQNPLSSQQQQQLQLVYSGLDERAKFFSGQPLVSGVQGGIGGPPLAVLSSLQMPAALQVSGLVVQPALLGKGAKQWRVGDWMCTSCINHNFASRNTCNRCGHPKTADELIV